MSMKHQEEIRELKEEHEGEIKVHISIKIHYSSLSCLSIILNSTLLCMMVRMASSASNTYTIY